jgi:hypothetical protein
MPYPNPNYFDADQPVTLDVADVMLPVLVNMARGAGINNVPPFEPPKPNVQEWMLGLMTRVGLQSLESIPTYGAPFVQRFDDRFDGATTATDALLFVDDVTLANTLASTFGVSLSKVYRTAAHYGFAIWTQDSGRFFIPCF